MNKLLLSAAVCLVSSCIFAAGHTITSLSDHAGLDKVLKVKTGDTIELPALEVGSYKINNTRVATLDGSMLTVVGPGMLGVQQLDAEGAITGETAAVLSVPDPIGNGRVFRWVCGHWSLSQEGWDTTNGGWEDLATGDRTSYPCQPDDIAILDRYKDFGFEINVRQNISVGGLMIGAYVINRSDMDQYKYRMRGNNDGSINTLTFARTDGKKAFIQICPAARVSGAENGVIKVAFGDGSYPLNVVCASDAELDLGWDGGDSFNTMAYLLFDKDCTLNIPEGKSFTLVNGSPFHNGSTFKSVECLGKLTGAGRFVNGGRAGVLADFNAAEFTGTLVEAGLGRDAYDRDAQMYLMNSDTYGNAKLEIDGFVNMRLDVNGRPNYEKQGGAGYFVIGTDHSYPERHEIGNRLPAREVRMCGGMLALKCENTRWTSEDSDLRVLEYRTERLVLDTGFSYINVSTAGSGYNNGISAEELPPVLFAAEKCEHSFPASAIINCRKLYARQGYSAYANLYCPWYAEQAVGGIVPWFVAQEAEFYMDSVGHLAFPYCDQDGYLTAANLTGDDLNNIPSGVNAYVENSKGMWIAEDKTVNSLVINNQNSNGSRCLGEGRKLTITSGGLVFNCDCSRLGDWKWGTTANELDSGCGTVEFGDTAYVYANNQTEERPNLIAAKIIATKGFVAAYPGFLAIVGDQTGIDREVVVTAGSLLLGCKINGEGNNSLAQANVDFGCKIDVPVRIVGGGATLKINKVNDQTLDSTQNVYFDDIGGYAGKLVIPEGSSETCAKCYVDNVTLPRGTYGATGSGAANIDDDHFGGLGTLTVSSDDLAVSSGLLIFIR